MNMNAREKKTPPSNRKGGTKGKKEKDKEQKKQLQDELVDAEELSDDFTVYTGTDTTGTLFLDDDLYGAFHAEI